MQTRYRTYVTMLVAGAFFMENLDGTIIATALPQMAVSFHTSAVALNVGMTAYLMTLAVFIPISGWVADRLGGRSIFRLAISIFTVASFLCSFSQTLVQFTSLRILQGIGGAMMVPVGRLIILRATPKDRLTQAIAWITWPGLNALVLGPPLGGFITTYFGWHWIFLLNLPLGVIAIILTLCLVDGGSSDFCARVPFDWPTFLLAGLASSELIYGLEKLSDVAINWHGPAIILALSILSGVLAILISRRSPYSLVDLESMKFKSYRLSIIGASGFRIAISVLPFLLPLMFQIGFHFSALKSGMYLLVLFAGDLCMKAFIMRVLRSFGFRQILIVNGLVTAGSIALCATLGPGTPPILICAILFFHGACRSLQFTCMTTLAYTEIAPEKMSRANGFLSAVTQLSLGMGMAIGAVTLRLIAHSHGHSAAAPVIRDFHATILCVTALALLPVVNAYGLAPDAGARTSGHQPKSERRNYGALSPRLPAEPGL